MTHSRISKKTNRLKHIHEGSRLGDFFLCFACIVVCIITIYPMYYVVIMSISDPIEAAAMNVFLYPKGLFFDSYRLIAKDKSMWLAYRNTIMYVVAQTVLTVLTSVLCAYPLTSKRLIGRRAVNIFLIITMYFGGGLIPTFLVRTKLGLYNNPWALIIPGCYSVWYIILTRTFFNSVPESLREAARIDGANHFQTLFQVYVPVSMPIIAVVAIYTIVSVWNGWFDAHVYLPTVEWQPLQLFLRRILVENTATLATGMTKDDMELMARMRLSNIQLKYALIVFSTLPVIFVYPFFQKHFVKGVMVGAVKG